MKRIMSSKLGLAIGLVLWMAAVCRGQAPEMAQPTKEHKLLEQFAGEWDTKAETIPAPGQEAIKCEGTESAKMIGGFWLVSHGDGSMMGMPVGSVLTIGYDPAKKKYVGTFLCSMDSTLWKYEGSMDQSGKKLTLETEGPSPMDPTKIAKFREILELKDKDHKAFTSFMQDENGKWVEIVKMGYERKK
jgi:hypothetical protein